MFWLAIVINIVVQLVFHPAIVGGNDFLSLASAITGRSVAFLLLPFIVLGITNAITSFTNKPIKYKISILWAAWLIFFIVSNWGYLV
jgi:hypothetical protein